MENWKWALIAGSAAVSVACLSKGSRSGSAVFGGVALAALASEYPDTFRRIRKNLPDYIERGTNFIEVATRIGERVAEAAESRSSAWYESLLHG